MEARVAELILSGDEAELVVYTSLHHCVAARQCLHLPVAIRSAAIVHVKYRSYT